MKPSPKQLRRDKLLYVSCHDVEKDPGVEKKIVGMCAAARANGFETERITEVCKSLDARRRLVDRVAETDAAIIIFRSFGECGFAVRNRLKKLRAAGHILICDQPSPMTTMFNEINHSGASFAKRMYNSAMAIYTGPWGFRPYHRVVEYAPESSFFSWGNRKRLMLCGNGIDVSRVPVRNYDGGAPDGSLRMVGVANTAVHHGYDRLIKAMAIYNGKHDKKAFFNIIGGNPDSPVIMSLKRLTHDLNMDDYVKFSGFRNQEFISDAYDRSDLAIGSLGLFRNNLHTSSILKIREYCLAGIPFMAAGADPDFKVGVPFRIVVPNDESIEPIADALEEFTKRKGMLTAGEIHAYAVEHLSLENKFKQITEGLL